MRKLIVIVILPPLLVWTFMSSLFRGLQESVWFALNDCGIEIASARQYWNGAKPKGRE